LPLDPYLVGALLGDGGLSTKRAIVFSCSEDEMLGLVRDVLPAGMFLRKAAGKNCDYTIVGQTWHLNPLLNALRLIGLSGKRSEDKFVPVAYKLGSPEMRMAVLQGLLDTDGSVSSMEKIHVIDFVSVSRQLAEDVAYLARSLGAVARMRKKGQGHYVDKKSGKQVLCQMVYRVTISFPSGMIPFRLNRKAKCIGERTKYEPTKAIKSMELVGRKLVQ